MHTVRNQVGLFMPDKHPSHDVSEAELIQRISAHHEWILFLTEASPSGWKFPARWGIQQLIWNIDAQP